VRGDVHVLNIPRGPKGPEQRGRRYGVVVQSDLLPLSTWLVAPTSTSAQPARFRPEVVVEGRRTRIMIEQTSAFDLQRFGPLVGQLSHDEMAEVDRALLLVLGFED